MGGMPYLQRGRKTWWGGYYALDGTRHRFSLGTSDRKSALEFEGALHKIAEQPEWHDVLEAIERGEVTVPEVYRAFATSSIAGLRSYISQSVAARRNVGLDTFVELWAGWCSGQRGVSAPVITQQRQRVFTLLNRKKPFRVSDLTPAAVQDWLRELPVGKTSLLPYSIALRSFVRYLRERGVLSSDPLAGIEWPSYQYNRTRFATAEELALLNKSFPRKTERQRAAAVCVMFCHATGAELNTALGVTWADVNFDTREVYLAGTKNAYRKRWARVANWYWPVLEDLAKHAR